MISFKIKKRFSGGEKSVKYEIVVKKNTKKDEIFDAMYFEVDKTTYDSFDVTKTYILSEHKGKEAR